ncbi:MAG: heavy metal translocating P-type ATPase metal-binding domain-containing protein [Bacteroidetes bacterium]|nr:heavy metal translocating P-type ATPase metal-binding domain-containing protein [Bacteroidota bacterium]
MLVKEALTCYHCGQACEDDQLKVGDKTFCCYGCQVVYEILNSNDLCQYYSLQDHPGTTVKQVEEIAYAYVDDAVVRQKLVEFDSPEFTRTKFFVPAVHCASCIWLLENLHKLRHGVVRSEVNFARKSVTIDFHPQKVKLSQLAALLASLGYPPQISLDNPSQAAERPRVDRGLLIKLAIAGFCFGNIMLFSFPEYLGLSESDAILRRLFSWLNIALSLPVFLYSDSDYFRSAWKSFNQRQINIDVPIAAGLLALFTRSLWDIITGFGPGYLDSFAGLVFFLLIGKWFQSLTYESLSFDRDYKSYFPLAVHRLAGGEWKPVVIYELKKGDEIRIRNLEIIPADSVLQESHAYIDYSFVTGEARPVKASEGNLLYAGGRIVGQPARMRVEKNTSQSQLTSLWNNDAFRKSEESKYRKIIDQAARRFTWAVLGIAFLTGVYWQVTNPQEMWLVLTSVLMVACPCALALAAPFTYGSMLRAFGRNHLYLKNADVIERLAAVDVVVFDKTGTVTHGQYPEIRFEGILADQEWAAVKTLSGSSTHPLSSLIHKHIVSNHKTILTDFLEKPGRGVEAKWDGKIIRMGSANYAGDGAVGDTAASRVYLSIDNEVKGCFVIRTSVRNGIHDMLRRLGNRCVALLSGDHEGDLEQMSRIFPNGTELRFHQTPHDKMEYISHLQQSGKKVLMVGDGLNDAGALRQSDVGIAVTDDTGVFTPACDGILQGDQVSKLDSILVAAKSSTTILKLSFALSFFYNAIALSVAVSGHLTPLVAAILMPISSISVVSFSTFAVNWMTRKKLQV